MGTVREEQGKIMGGDQNRIEEAALDQGLYDKLVRYCEGDYYPYHMPGHKRSRKAGAMAPYYGIDITEIDGFDNLHHAEGILQAAQQRANRLYGNEESETFYLVNGSTCGVLVSVMTAAGRGAEILIARNCHKSVYHAAILQELRLHYYEPPVLEKYGICAGVDAEEIDCLLQRYPGCAAVVITSPTYEGILSDVRAIADVVHARDSILIVDEAHGAHLGMHESVPQGALAQGADLVIHSLHKSLPAMTQTALLHVQGERIDRGRLRRYLAMLQSSSPSYVLMASMDSCIRYMETHGSARYLFMQRQYELFCKKMEKRCFIEIGNIDYAEERSGIKSWDTGKLVIGVKDCMISGLQLYDLLRDEYHLQMEMAAESYVLAIMTVMDSEEGWQRLADALLEIDDRIGRGMIAIQETADRKKPIKHEQAKMQLGKEAKGMGLRDRQETGKQPNKTESMDCGMTVASAYLGAREEVPLAGAVGRVAADFINLYPPGIPLAVPGEMVSEELLWQIQKYRSMGLQVQGVTATGNICVNPLRTI